MVVMTLEADAAALEIAMADLVVAPGAVAVSAVVVVVLVVVADERHLMFWIAQPCQSA